MSTTYPADWRTCEHVGASVTFCSRCGATTDDPFPPTDHAAALTSERGA
jgi:hypothetical protein